MRKSARGARLQGAEALDPIHLVLFHQELDAFSVLRDDLILAVEHLGIIEFRILTLDTLLGGVFEVFPNIGRME